MRLSLSLSVERVIVVCERMPFNNCRRCMLETSGIFFTKAKVLLVMGRNRGIPALGVRGMRFRITYILIE